jgi:PAS domain S-box-containing protein
MTTDAGLLSRLRAWLPHGRTLADDVWDRRHRVLLGVLWANVVGLSIYGIAQGFDVRHTFIDVAFVALAALLGTLMKSRHARAAMVSFGLISAAAVLVHLSKGVIEAHFYFFVLIVALTLYEDWIPLLIAIGYVAFHHGVLGTVAPETVYNHGDAVDHPWKWAGIHAGFVLAAAAAAIAAWRLNEDVRFRLTGVVASSGDAIVELDLDGRISAWNPAASELLGYSVDEVLERSVGILTPEDQRDELSELLTAAAREGSSRSREITLRTKGGAEVPVSLRVSPIRDLHQRMLGTSLVARDMRDRARTERYRGVQLAVSAALAESATVEEAMPQVLAALGEGLSWDAAVHWRLDGDVLRCESFWHVPGDELERLEHRVMQLERPVGHGALGQVVASREPSWVENVAEDRGLAANGNGLAGLGIVTVPLVSEDAVIGVLEFFATHLGSQDGELMQTLSVISGQVAHFIGRKEAEDEAERLKDEFFGLVSHELRTPLTSVIGYTDMLAKLEADQLTDRGKKMVEVISRNAKRELRLVGDLLLLVKIEAGKFDIEHGEVDLGAVAQDSSEAVRVMAEQAEVELGVQADPIPPFDGDADRIGQAIDNLLTNAIKFTPEGGRVQLRVINQGGHAIVAVEDTGMGIPQEDQERLFERLYRASSATEGHVPGTGLGLTIVKAIAEAHGGHVEVESEPGEGSIFRIVLPLQPAGSNGAVPVTEGHSASNGNGGPPVNVTKAHL